MIDNDTAPDLFLAALSLRDFERFSDCLAPSVQARLLLPRKTDVLSGREEVAQRFDGWFGHASDFAVLYTGREHVGSRSRLTWRLRMSRNGEAPEVIEQVAFVDLGDDGIANIDLLCSGFHPEEAPAGS